MHIYTTGQWVLLFFFYCFCGWVWESCYVSLCQRHWVNRGFLHGPLLPIYGSGAIIILLATIPVANDLRLVYLFGLLAATALEYVTGDVMERIFKVRYWDYSNQKFNLNGHICLSSSVAWGFFSILLVRFVHPPVARLLARVPALCVDPLAFALTAVFTVDAVRSVQAALDLRDILVRAMEENEELRRLAKRAEVYAAFAGDDLRRFRERTELEKALLQQRVEEQLAEHRQARAERVEASLRRLTGAKLEILSNISGALETCRDRLEEHAGLTPETLAQRREELESAIRRVREREASLRSRSAKAYHRSLRILRAHPSATAKELGEALETLKKLGKD
ncbi:MAG: hypothetical protein HFG04_10600 [Oscillibacter sp.]|jgi:uncharacterized membrane protein|nr:hypothetical protein [Oscillibacter sp.]MCI9003410.1 hypothetical protein [Oscillibacter sp.]